jgi:diacylglycerol kinase (CTP)
MITIKDEIYRKLFHFCLVLLPISFLLIKNKKIFFIFLFTATFLIVLIDLIRAKYNGLNKIFVAIFGKIMRDYEINQSKLTGLSYVFISASIVFYFAKPVVSVMSFFILAIADGFASIVGKSIKSRAFFQKTLAGSITFFLLAVIVILISGYYFNYRNISFYFYGLLAVIFATALESRSDTLNLDDNCSVPIGFSLSLSFLDAMWHFL